VRQAEADLRAASSLRWPELALRAEESREDESRIFLGGIRFSVPLFNRGQGEHATAAARLQRAQWELQVARQNAIADAAGAYAEYTRRRAAAEELRANALPLLADTVHLTERSYEAGEIDLAEVLTVRREALEARSRYLDRVRDAAEAAVDLQARAGMRSRSDPASR
jgi:cobalt-zinc-cadmium efflux system outer membrane protein